MVLLSLECPHLEHGHGPVAQECPYLEQGHGPVVAGMSSLIAVRWSCCPFNVLT